MATGIHDQSRYRSFWKYRGHILLPVSPGSFSVGCVDVATKNGIFARIYYPHKRHNSACEKVDYIKNSVWRCVKWLPGVEYATAYLNFRCSIKFPSIFGHIFTWLICNPSCPVLENVSLVSDEELQFPLTVFSHGNGGCRTTYSIFCQDIASEGHIVVALEHSDRSACIGKMLNDDGELIWIFPKEVCHDDYNMRHSQVMKRSQECIEAVELLRALDQGIVSENVIIASLAKKNIELSDFKGRIDWSCGVSVCGHSFGGASALQALLSDQFQNAFLVDCWMFPIQEEIELMSSALNNKPVFFLNYEKFQWGENLDTMENFRKVPLIFRGRQILSDNVVGIRSAIHYTASDLPTVFSYSYVKYALEPLNFLSKLLHNGAHDHVDPRILSSEQGLSLTSQTYLKWMKTLRGGRPDQLEIFLQENKSHLIWGD